ncbi:Uncharacterised protein [Neisseria gonorrhoeae]|uniref:Uncharacterized protein n=1 Tax=Neisseria gonorrhoeae TaxID=485 RepID=A0A378VZS7_NEIGO|nr:Uncharacterised protein [Neisseria gonorrhoeae]
MPVPALMPSEAHFVGFRRHRLKFYNVRPNFKRFILKGGGGQDLAGYSHKSLMMQVWHCGFKALQV